MVSNTPPTANAGVDQPIHAGTVVNLNGSASFDDNTATAALGYAWSFSSVPAGSTATLVGANTATPSFTPDLVGDYVVQLIVTDEGGLPSAADSVTLSSYNQAPTAVATATAVLPVVGQAVTLDGTASTDPEGDVKSYLWSVTTKPPGSVASLLDATVETASFTPDVAGTFVVSLTVSDFLGAGTPASVTFVASTVDSYAEAKIISACVTVEGLSPSQVSNKGNQKEFCKLLRKAVGYIQKGHYCKAVGKLDKAIERTDGCPLRGTPDEKGSGRDWITDCDVQAVIYEDLLAARNALALLPDCGTPGDGDDDDDDDKK